METWIVLLIIAAVLVIIEVATQMVWTLCLAFGCVAAALLSVCGVSAEWTIGMTSILTLIFYIFMIPVLTRWQEKARKRNGKRARTGMEALLGRVAVVTNEIRPGELGRARIDGDYWQVRIPGLDRVIKRGEEVVVTSYDSIILDVEVKN